MYIHTLCVHTVKELRVACERVKVQVADKVCTVRTVLSISPPYLPCSTITCIVIPEPYMYCSIHIIHLVLLFTHTLYIHNSCNIGYRYPIIHRYSNVQLTFIIHTSYRRAPCVCTM